MWIAGRLASAKEQGLQSLHPRCIADVGFAITFAQFRSPCSFPTLLCQSNLLLTFTFHRLKRSNELHLIGNTRGSGVSGGPNDTI